MSLAVVQLCSSDPETNNKANGTVAGWYRSRLVSHTMAAIRSVSENIEKIKMSSHNDVKLSKVGVAILSTSIPHKNTYSHVTVLRISEHGIAAASTRRFGASDGKLLLLVSVSTRNEHHLELNFTICNPVDAKHTS